MVPPSSRAFARETEGIVEVFEPYTEGLVDVDGFERIWLLFLMDRHNCAFSGVDRYHD